MSHGVGKESKKDSNDFIEKFNEILHSLSEEYGRKQAVAKTLTESQKNVVRSLHELATSGELKLDRLAAETTSLCDTFISNWESTGIKSAAVQQLIALLNRPHIRGLMISVEDVASNKYLPKLPAIPFEVDEDEGIVVKVVRIVKRDETVGVTLKNDCGKIYIARLIAGGVAARSACIQEGDRILEVNGLPIAELSVDDVARILNRVDHGTVTLKLVPADIPTRSENGTPHVYIRAQYDYNGKNDERHPCPEVSIAFSKGDILELLACNDDHWWQARRIGNGAFASSDDIKGSSRIGLIPSEALQLAKATSEHEQKKTDSRGSIRSKGSHDAELVYESVCRIVPREDASRIVVLLGPPGVGRNELKRRLLARYPQRFSTTVPHTTRAMRVGEVEGVDYYFVERPVMEKMIYFGQMLEYGEYKGNLYGTALASVHDAKRRGTLLITPHPLALPLLRTSEFMPFIIFIQPPDKVTFKATRAVGSQCTRASTSTLKRGGCGRFFTDTEIEQVLESSALLYKQYRHLLDATLINKDLEESCTQLLRLINDLETKPTWVPLSWATHIRSD
nr:PDZ and Variant SH3 and Guanylate kinase domain containing protein [Haemonchus contortus]